MTDLEELRWLFRIDRADRDGLRAAIEELEAGDPFERAGVLGSAEQRRYLQARSNVDSVERVLEAGRASGSGSGSGRRKRTVTVDMSSYQRDSEYLSSVASERAARSRLREAAERRLSHFEKRDRYFYRQSAMTPLECYQAALISVRDVQGAKS